MTLELLKNMQLSLR